MLTQSLLKIPSLHQILHKKNHIFNYLLNLFATFRLKIKQGLDLSLIKKAFYECLVLIWDHFFRHLILKSALQLPDHKFEIV